MIIKSIELENFRNYDSLNINFDEHTTILFGDNAQGKTNILESAYMSGTTKSHKGSRDKEIIKFDKNESHIKTVISKNDRDYQIDIHLKKNKSKGIAMRSSDARTIRGNILDRNGIKLASDEFVYEVYAHPTEYSKNNILQVC